MSTYFEQLVTDHGEIVMRVLIATLGRTDAQDCWQETFVAALKAYDREELSNPRGWLLTIAHRKALDHIRSASRRHELTERLEASHEVETTIWPEEPSALIIRSLNDADELRSALGALPPKQQHAVVYRYIGDLPYDEIAALLNCTQAAARRNVFEGLKQLKRTFPARSTA